MGRAHAPPSPRSICRPWPSAGSRNERFSCTALGLPGRLTISVLARMAATARVSMARGVYCRLLATMAAGIPGTIRSAISQVASGVQSRGAKPVPPVVSSRSHPPPSHSSRMAAASRSRSSGSRTVRVTSIPACSHICAISAPLSSTRSPRLPLSLAVSTATR